MNVTAVIPTYNERENIEDLVAQILALGPEFHVLVVDDNSPDGTGEIVHQLQQENERVHVIHRARKSGLGTAYMDGMTLALAEGADFVVQMDADFSHPPAMLPELLAIAKRTDADVVIGTRYSGGGRIKGWPIVRHLLSRGGNLYARMLLGSQFSDYTSGFMLHRSTALRELPFREFGCSNFAFLLELKSEYGRRKLHAEEMPIEFVNRTRGASKISMGIVFEAFRIVLQINRRMRRERALGVTLPVPAADALDAISATEGPKELP
jgi:dolichol-phosphate mannosyltransferase